VRQVIMLIFKREPHWLTHGPRLIDFSDVPADQGEHWPFRAGRDCSGGLEPTRCSGTFPNTGPIRIAALAWEEAKLAEEVHLVEEQVLELQLLWPKPSNSSLAITSPRS
jgi:hypothetical protein